MNKIPDGTEHGGNHGQLQLEDDQKIPNFGGDGSEDGNGQSMKKINLGHHIFKAICLVKTLSNCKSLDDGLQRGKKWG